MALREEAIRLKKSGKKIKNPFAKERKKEIKNIRKSLQRRIKGHNLTRLPIEVKRTAVLRELLFTNPKEESPSTRFMGRFFAGQGEKIKQLAHFVTGEKTESLEVFFYGSNSRKENHSKPTFMKLIDEGQYDKYGLTNQEVLQLLHKTKEMPVVQVRNKEGKILFGVSFSQGKWYFAEETTPDKLNGSWFGNVNFYSNNGRINTSQIIEKMSKI